ncbi:MAG: hypothetical protein VR72_17940 [Clostridiaceae bacterium BRH_c20a]|nr:MAG: hypothetical protein VR72_17940 [Clostridiaceae bacterium BRH_c20a]
MKNILSFIREYGIKWIFHRLVYSLKLKSNYFKWVLPIDKYEMIALDNALLELSQDKNKLSKLYAERYFSLDKASIKAYYDALKDSEKENITRIADAIAEGQFRCFENVILDYGQPMNWFINPINGLEYNKQNHWSKIGDFSNIGDIKIGWEPSRFLFTYDLLRAYLISGDKKYAETFWHYFDSWYDANPIEQGINWKCSQEISIRILSITTGIVFFLDLESTTQERLEKYFKVLKSSLKHVFINRNYAIRSIKNDHTFVESFALYVFGKLFSHVGREFEIYQQHGKFQFEKEIRDQFYRDGGYKQNSYNYQRIVIQLISIYYMFNEISEDVYKVLEQVLVFLNNSMMNSHFEVVNFGPSDSGMIFPLIRDYQNYSNCVNLLSYVLKGRLLYKDFETLEEISWFQDYNQIELQKNKIVKNNFYESGIHFLKNERFKAFFRAGEQHHRPYHNDMFHVDLWYKGFNVLCDMGTYSYNFSYQNSKYYSSALAHNTLTVEPTESFKTIGNFLVINWIHGKVLSETSNQLVAVRRVGGEVFHTRSLILESKVFMIQDQVTSNVVKNYLISYNILAKDIYKFKLDEDVYRIILGDGSKLDLSIVGSNIGEYKVSLRKELNDYDSVGWFSKSYLQRERSFTLTVEFLKRLNVDILMNITIVDKDKDVA